MFVTELTPIFKQLAQHPVSFLGGFFSGILRLNLSDEPASSWMSQQLGTTYTSAKTQNQNGKTTGPQSISID